MTHPKNRLNVHENSFSIVFDRETLVTQVKLDYALWICTQECASDSPQRDAQKITVFDICISQDCLMSTTEGDVALHKDQRAVASEQLVSIVNSKVRKIWGDTNSVLRIELEGDRVISASADANYEAWSVTLSTGEMVVCCPGGEYAFWNAR